MERIHQNRPREGIFLQNSGGHDSQTPLLYVPDRTNGPLSVIPDS